MEQTVRVLVVEDDDDINQLLCRIVKRSNYKPQSAYSGTEALRYLEERDWDLVLLDLMLPGLSGEKLLEKIAEKRIPVMIISAKNEKDTKIQTLRAGADDYITKPFDIDEVSARIDSLLRRSRRNKEPENHFLEHKDIVLEIETKTVNVNGYEVQLTAREFEILKLFMTSPKKVFSKANLYESIWHEPFYGDDNAINVHISNL